MKGVLIDTCIWSSALRGKEPKDKDISTQLARLIKEDRAKIIGPIRQEVLSGYSNTDQFEKLRLKLEHFPNQPISDSNYETAAKYFNLCRKKAFKDHISII